MWDRMVRPFFHAVGRAPIVILATPLWAADATRGKIAFQQCEACHSLVPGEIKTGPSLAGVMGRKAGSTDDYSYSQAMKNCGLVWNDATLRRYLASPKAVVPGTKMAFAGIKDPKRLDDLIAYLRKNAR